MQFANNKWRKHTIVPEAVAHSQLDRIRDSDVILSTVVIAALYHFTVV